MNKEVIKYYARGKDIAKMGPFNSEVEAWEALMGLNGLPIPGATVWLEKHLEKKDRR